ncbi:putative toxin-antitoxin system toxin component, PIN family [Salinisphaera sp. PC39]|uniref:putative toxin-antitoxin system toxin component, PIN family n=1 Tax=Salinisphaera sp. PC39 TaxID=1304156 RepID=UPI003341691F
MTPDERVVVDSNALVSRLLLPSSVPGRAVSRIVREARLLVSEATMAELAEVLSRRKFDSYVTVAERKQFLRLLSRVAEYVPIVRQVRECRDPRDDKFLEVAVNGDANWIVTGDRDLLALDPFENIRIVTPADYPVDRGS